MTARGVGPFRALRAAPTSRYTAPHPAPRAEHALGDTEPPFVALWPSRPLRRSGRNPARTSTQPQDGSRGTRGRVARRGSGNGDVGARACPDASFCAPRNPRDAPTSPARRARSGPASRGVTGNGAAPRSAASPGNGPAPLAGRRARKTPTAGRQRPAFWQWRAKSGREAPRSGPIRKRGRLRASRASPARWRAGRMAPAMLCQNVRIAHAKVPTSKSITTQRIF